MRRVAIGLLVMFGVGCRTEVSSVEIGSATTTISNASTTAVPIPLITVAPTSSEVPATTTSTSTTSTSTTTTLPPPPTTTSCSQIVHIGDSTSLGLWAPEDVGGADSTMEARYLGVGVDVVYPDVDGGRSIVETQNPSQINAYDVAAAVKSNGYEGCWVLMIGTNDAANVAAGSTIGFDERINKMLTLFGDDQVLWVDAVSLLANDPIYGSQVMKAWNEALYRLTAGHPNVAVLQWSGLVKAGWFARDGLHYNQTGNAQRAAITGAAMVEYFPG